VTWTSSEEDIATVENGVVTAKAVGETTITATAGDVTDVCTVEVIECGHTDGTNNDGQCRTCGYQFAFKATDADGNLKGFYDKIYDAFVQMPISGGTVTVLKDADGETQYSPNVTKTFVVDMQDHKLSCNDVHGFSPRARVTITGGKDSQIDTVTADQYVNVTLASTFQGTITTLKNGTQIAEAVDVERSSAWFEIPTQVLGVGTHKLTARYVGSKNMAGTSVSFTVTVKPCEITGLALDETQLTYTGAAQAKGVASVTAGSLTLAASDYDVSGNVQTAVGSYKLTVTGKGNYTGTLTGEYTIAKAAAPEAEHGTMTVSNNHAATYEMEIPALPALDAGTYGAVSYALGEVKANTAYSWKFVPEDEENYESLTGSITLYAVSHSGGGGGGGSSSGSSGSAAKTDDVTTTVKTDENGNTQTDVKVSDKALSDAKKSGEAVKIPTGVKAGEDSNSAPVVKIDLPKNAGETKIEVPVDNVTPGTVAVIVHEDGTEEILSSSKPTEDGLEFTIDGSATIKVIDNSKTFVDTGDHWAKGAIDYISARDLVSGVGDKLFAPDLTATRAQLWTILARMNGETVTGGQTWYELPQLWAKKNGVSDGTDSNGTITRAQLVTMLWRTAGSPTAGSETKFTDVPADSYYAQAVAWAAANGITNGVGSGRFDPEAPCTRAQLATFLYQNMK
jgi:hypothetical protein